MNKFYGYKKCSTSNKAEKYLQEFNVEYQFIDLKEKGITKTTLKKVLRAKKDIKKILNTSGNSYKEMNLKDKLADLSNDEVIDLMVKDPMLVKRPIFIDEEHDKIYVGFVNNEFK
ncbi:Spx/MgsR family RNA polymerase-binding regulatory protein [Mycoplasmopsis ciconiae]|uniref:Spx/MgsR family RNA polymerase-binding regulatory protein n=1 Tax=Mycoplasmopsis ciconiae TaxID=561067 RepID=A0ABU7MLN7_9BACT|nr:Spx/MgsR family RNA polymerase-binding regulatory protein [Mycoplasmopsis ciconiae]